jgi:hypothetical protein
LSAHVKDGNDEVNRTKNGGHTGKVEAKDTEIDGRAGVSLKAAKGWVDGSSGTNSDLDKGGKKKKGKCWRKKSET